MGFRIIGLSPAPYRHLFGLPDDELTARGVKRYWADKPIGFPDRIELRDAAVGESLLLLNYVHQPADTPFRASHAIFVREGADTAFDAVNVVPPVLGIRTLSLRAFDAAGMMIDAALAEGCVLEAELGKLLDMPETAYIHAHFAVRGCYACRVERS